MKHRGNPIRAAMVVCFEMDREWSRARFRLQRGSSRESDALQNQDLDESRVEGQLVPNSSPEYRLFARRLEPPGLLARSLLLTVDMHLGNMGIQQFHDSQSFPRHWPVLGFVSVFFWSVGSCEIRCFGNVFSCDFALAGVLLCLFALKNKTKKMHGRS
jgi:hypothetical protein